MSDNLRERVARAIANVREGGWPADTYAMLQQHYLTMADAALAEIGEPAPAPSVREDKPLNMLCDLYQRHMHAARAGDEPTRKRLFGLIKEFEWAFSDVAEEHKRRFGGNPGAVNAGAGQRKHPPVTSSASR